MDRPIVAILMGSDSDLAVMRGASEVLGQFGVPHETHVLSAHRSPERLADYVKRAPDRGTRIFLCGAGMAAHLAGAVAAHTPLPVIGVPLSAGGLGGLDALYATVQMPPGVPVATVGIDGARNAALLAVRVLALADADLARRLAEYRQQIDREAQARDQRLQALGPQGYLDEKAAGR